jgi:hypothetical protein
MHKTVKFGVYEKQVRALLGERYDLASFVEGTDYKRFKTGYASRVMFRNGMLEELGGKPAETNVSPNSQGILDSSPVQEKTVEKEQKPVGLQEVIVTRKYPNPRYVETTGGQVFVGGKPVKLGQRIRVRNNELVLKPGSYLG